MLNVKKWPPWYIVGSILGLAISIILLATGVIIPFKTGQLETVDTIDRATEIGNVDWITIHSAIVTDQGLLLKYELHGCWSWETDERNSVLEELGLSYRYK